MGCTVLTVRSKSIKRVALYATRTYPIRILYLSLQYVVTQCFVASKSLNYSTRHVLESHLLNSTGHPKVAIILENSQIKPLALTDQIKDLGILLDERLSFRDHINDKIIKAFSMLGIIKRNFKHLTIQSFIMLYKNVVRSHLDYCFFVWSPYMKKDIEALEKVQKRATKILPQLKHMNYSDRLKACKLPIIHYTIEEFKET